MAEKIKLAELKNLLNGDKALNIVVTTHHKPDADALGSSLGLRGILLGLGHQVTVVSPTDYPKFLQWMKGNEEVVIYNDGNEKKAAKLANDADLIFCLDFCSLSRINNFGNDVKNSKAPKVLIDHHIGREDFAEFLLWDPQAAATAELIYEFSELMEARHLLEKDSAEALYAGIMTDTGSFRHPSTSKKVHLIVSELIDLGIENSKIHGLIFDSNSEERLRFLGHVLKDKLVVLRDRQTAYIAVSSSELKKYHSQTGDTEGVVNYALSIDGIKFAALIVEREDAVKLSFRSIGDFAVNEFASEHFNGGGHKNAAGGISKENLDQTLNKFLKLVNELPDNF